MLIFNCIVTVVEGNLLYELNFLWSIHCKLSLGRKYQNKALQFASLIRRPETSAVLCSFLLLLNYQCLLWYLIDTICGSVAYKELFHAWQTAMFKSFMFGNRLSGIIYFVSCIRTQNGFNCKIAKWSIILNIHWRAMYFYPCSHSHDNY